MSQTVSRRSFLVASAAAGGAAASSLARSADAATDQVFDLIVVGGGNAGMPAAIFAAQRGASVLIIEAASQLGGTLHLSSGQLSAGGTKLQKSKGIQDSWELHYQDIMRISRGTANPVIAKLACQNAPDTFDWLMDNGFEVRPEHPVTGTNHEPYSQARYAWGMNGGRSILKVLNAHMQPHLDSGKVAVRLSTKAKALLQNSAGAVIGVETEDEEGKTASYRAKNVVLTTGGFASNSEMFKIIDGQENYNDSSYPYSQGEGITLGVKAGAVVRGGEHYTPLFGAILSEPDLPAPIAQTFRTLAPARMPFEIYLNADGKRFIAEDSPSHDAHEQALLAQPKTLSWVVFDEAMINAAPQIMTRVSRDQYRAMFNNRPFFYSAGTIEELAQKAGFDPAGAAASVASYNQAQASGKDALGRKHMPLPLDKAPFYAIKLHSWKYTTFGGLAVDGQLRVTDKAGRPIPGLYAAGEVIGCAATMGQSYCGGMAVTPALTFGRLLGQRILNFA